MKCVIAVAFLMLVPAVAWSHPGRLDKTGCHQVRKDFAYKSGKIAKRGDYHCHRLLTGEKLPWAVILDGREVLMDSRKDVEQDDDGQLREGEAP